MPVKVRPGKDAWKRKRDRIIILKKKIDSGIKIPGKGAGPPMSCRNIASGYHIERLIESGVSKEEENKS